MPTLDEIRQKFANAQPIREESKIAGVAVVSPTPEKMKARAEKYTISVDGDDALMKVGKHNGKTLSDIAHGDGEYLNWIVHKSKFGHDLKDVARQVMRANGVAHTIEIVERIRTLY